MEPIKNKIPGEYQEAFQLGLLGDNPTARNIVFELLEEKLCFFGLVWSVAIFCPQDALGAHRWLRRASKILEDHRNSQEKTFEEEVLYLIESYMRIRSRENIIHRRIPDPLLKIEELMSKLGDIVTKYLNDEKSNWTRLLKVILFWDVLDSLETNLESEDPEELLEELIKYDPSNEYYWYLKETVTNSDSGFKTSLKMNPNLALAYFQQANANIKGRRVNKNSVSLLDKAIEISPRFAEAHFAKAMALQQLSMKQYKTDIIKHINIGIELDPENADYHYQKGYLLVDLHQFEEATKCFDKALEFEPTYGHAYNQLAYIHISHRNYAEAIRAYLNAIKLGSEVEQNLSNISRAIYDLEETSDSAAIKEEVFQFFASLTPTPQNVTKIVIL